MHLRSAPFGSEITAVEILGGGVRMQVVQQAVIDCMGEVNQLLFKLFSTFHNSNSNQPLSSSLFISFSSSQVNIFI